jgi:CRP/FNR family cyclic AMP-dependent transcriptional regulator
MATTLAELREHLADPLAQLPSPVKREYRRGQIIYGCHEPSTSIYLLVAGKVKLSRVTEDGRRVVVDIYQTGELFGESAFLNSSRCEEEAVALEDTKVLTWTAAEVADFAEQRPRVGLSLMQILAQRTIELGDRIESFSADNTARRLARTLIRLSERLGRVTEDGGIRMMPLTHELLSQYVGTSREIVTHCMNQFRREHCVNYSRKDGILVYRDALKEWLQHSPDPETASHAT